VNALLLDVRPDLRVGRSYYDYARNPPSFNFVDHMLVSERWRIANGHDRLEFVALPGPMQGFRKDHLPPAGGAERIRWHNNIVRQMPILLPSCGQPIEIDPYATGPGFARGEYLIGFKSLVQSAAADCYPLRAPADLVEQARNKWGSRYVTLTHRDVAWWRLRQPQLEEWRKVADKLGRAGFRFVLIPEGTKADEPVPGFETDPEAGRNSLARAALYAGAEMNFGIPSGPMWMCWFLGVPTLIMRMVDERDDSVIPGQPIRPPTTARRLRHSGLFPGQSLPNARRCQKILWADDTAANVLDAFDRLMSS
jgi:hypothetical protein